MSLPINRSAKATLDANLVNGITSDAPALKASDDVVYNTIDELYNYALSLVTSGTLSPLPPNNVQYQSLFNGGFSVNQRAVSGTVILSAGQYGHDRWKAGSAGCTYAFATVNNITTITITAGSLVQVIEGSNLYDGTYTLSWAGTAQGKIGAGSYGSSGITGTVGGGTNLSIEFNIGTVSKAQLNKGSTPFTYQPRSFADELRLCQRYYWKSFPYTTAPVQNCGSGAGALFGQALVANQAILRLQTVFPVMMRVIPTLTLYNPAAANAQARNSSRALDCSSTGILDISDRNFIATTLTPTGTFLVDDILLHATADAEL